MPLWQYAHPLEELRRRLNSYGRRKLKETAEDCILRLYNAVATLRLAGYTQNRAGRWLPPRMFKKLVQCESEPNIPKMGDLKGLFF